MREGPGTPRSALREMLDERENLNSKSWTEPRTCMVLGLKPKGKPSAEKNISLGQNLGLAWSSDSSLRENQVLRKT